MRKIEKDLGAVPVSLRHPDSNDFANGHEHRRAQTTHDRRMELVGLGSYPNKDAGTFNERYKQADTKSALDGIYHNHCAYCEEYVEAGQVEHYRPKSTYLWLAYSWDNLLYVCPTCNTTKNNRFVVDGTPVVVPGADFDWTPIHSLGVGYDAIERPRLVNPEVESPEAFLRFSLYGEILADDPRYQHTIRVCGLDRDALKARRKKIVDDLRNDLASAFAKYSGDELRATLKNTLDSFKQRKTPQNGFFGFRSYVILHWLREVLAQAQSDPAKD
jgi:uncharacterized protein (TIGR02646 family)